MTPLLASLLPLPLLFLSSTVLRAAQEPEGFRPEPDRSGQGFESTVEGVEILRRLLGSRLETSEDPDRLEVAGMRGFNFIVNGIPKRLSSSRGYHLPGVGAIFSMDVSVPVIEDTAAAAPPSDEERPRTEADREWERMRRRVLTGRDTEAGENALTLLGSINGVKDKHWKLDDKAIARIEVTVLETIARHGDRIPGLEPDETITVALHLEGDFQLPRFLSTKGGEGMDASLDLATWGNIYASQQVAPIRLVLSVPVRALAGVGVNGTGLEAVRRAALIHRY